MITVFSVMVFSFGMTSFQKANTSIYNSDLVTYDSKSLTEESRWTLEQISTSSNGSTGSTGTDKKDIGNSSVIVTNPEGKDLAFVWGSNSNGQLGNGEKEEDNKDPWIGNPIKDPVPIEFGMDYSDIKFLLVEGNSVMAVLTDENGNDFLYAWGDNTSGQLGLGDTDKTVTEPQLVDLRKVTGTTDYKIKSIDTVESAAYIVLTIDGKDSVWSTGLDIYGQLGTGGGTTSSYNQVEFPPEDNVNEIISSDFGPASKVAALTDKGESVLYTWGYNEYLQQYPNDYTKNQDTPIRYTYFPESANIEDKKIKQVSVDGNGWNSMIVLTDNEGNDELYTWGENDHGQLGQGFTGSSSRTPVLVEFPDTYSEIKDINSTSRTSSAVTVGSDGKEHLYLWGWKNDYFYGETKNYNRDKNAPFEMKFENNIYSESEYTYTIKEVSLSHTYQAVIVDYRGSTQLYMWGIGYMGSMGPDDDTGSSTNKISKIDVIYQTPMITFDNGPPSVISDKDKGKMLSFTLDWDANTVTPTKLDIIDSNGDTLIGAKKFSLNNELNGVEQEMNIEGVIPEGVENARFKILDDTNKTLVISQSFNIDESLLDTFDDNISANYNWLTAKKKLSFTLNYPSSISLDSVQVKEVGTDKLIDIIIEPEGVISGEEYKINISDLKNKSKLHVYISAEFTNGYTIESEDFYIPATKFPGWITSLIALIIIITTIILIIITSIIWRKKAAYNKHHKMHKMKRAYR